MSSMNGVRPDYHSNARYEIASLLPTVVPTRVLEIGSGTGATIQWLAQRWPSTHFTAIDGLDDARSSLEAVAQDVLIADLNHKMPPLGRFDLILALDVLEHLIDPWSMLSDLVDRLAEDGAVIVSVPNVSRVTVSVPLLFLNRFRYAENGILDRTHLRFFTPQTAIELMAGAGLRVDEARLTGLDGPRVRLLDRVSFGLLRPYLGKQTVMRGKKHGVHSAIRWKPV